MSHSASKSPRWSELMGVIFILLYFCYQFTAHLSTITSSFSITCKISQHWNPFSELFLIILRSLWFFFLPYLVGYRLIKYARKKIRILNKDL